ncbi:hypothetical protein ACH4LS_37150 [Streptomyces luteogriseus]|uniref:hypothetical protein n=1 Tax=Streptomyces luteogriseus TaxID=68233 RepID=UPI00378CF12B
MASRVVASARVPRHDRVGARIVQVDDPLVRFGRSRLLHDRAGGESFDEIKDAVAGDAVDGDQADVAVGGLDERLEGSPAVPAITSRSVRNPGWREPTARSQRNIRAPARVAMATRAGR